MSRGLNKVMIIGHLGRDPEMRFTPSGRPVTTFSVATTRNWKTAEGERRESTEWFTIVAWGSLAEICKEHLVKGQQVYIEGRLQTRRWDDEDGNKRQATEIVAREMVMLGQRKKRADDDADATPDDPPFNEEDAFGDENEDEFPF